MIISATKAISLLRNPAIVQAVPSLNSSFEVVKHQLNEADCCSGKKNNVDQIGKAIVAAIFALPPQEKEAFKKYVNARDVYMYVSVEGKQPQLTPL